LGVKALQVDVITTNEARTTSDKDILHGKDGIG
jgi:hypothetical protein